MSIEGKKSVLIKKSEIIKGKKAPITSNADARRARGDETQKLQDFELAIKKKIDSRPSNARADFAALFNTPPQEEGKR